MSIRSDGERLYGIVRALQARIEELHSNSRRAAEGETASGIQAAREAALAAAATIFRQTWGTFESGERLQGGSVWPALEAADKRIGASRGAGDSAMKWDALAYASAHLVTVFPECRNLTEIEELYSTLSPVEQRAAQDLAARGFFKRRFASTPGIASFSAELARDREAASSPGLPAAVEAKAELVADVLALWRASQGAVNILEAGIAGVSGRPLSRILGMVVADGEVLPVAEGDREAGEYWSFERKRALELPPGATYLDL